MSHSDDRAERHDQPFVVRAPTARPYRPACRGSEPASDAAAKLACPLVDDGAQLHSRIAQDRGHTVAGGVRRIGGRAIAGRQARKPAGLSEESASLLAVAVRYHFRRAVEEDPRLFQGLAFAQLERIGKAPFSTLKQIFFMCHPHR